MKHGNSLSSLFSFCNHWIFNRYKFSLLSCEPDKFVGEKKNKKKRKRSFEKIREKMWKFCLHFMLCFISTRSTCWPKKKREKKKDKTPRYIVLNSVSKSSKRLKCRKSVASVNEKAKGKLWIRLCDDEELREWILMKNTSTIISLNIFPFYATVTKHFFLPFFHTPKIKKKIIICSDFRVNKGKTYGWR